MLQGIILAMMLLLPAYAQTTTEPDPIIGAESSLYGLKIAIENLQSFLTFNDESRAKITLDQAEERVKEINALLKKNAIEKADEIREKYAEKIEIVKRLENKQAKDTRGKQIQELIASAIENHEKRIGQIVSNFVHEQNLNKASERNAITNIKEKILTTVKEAKDYSKRMAQGQYDDDKQKAESKTTTKGGY